MNRKQAAAEDARLKGLSDDELIADAIYTGGVAPASRFAVDGEALGQLAHDALDSMVTSFRRPSYRAGFGTSMLSGLMLVRAGMRPGVAVFISVMIGAAAEKLYEMAEDVHETAVLQREYLEKQTNEAGQV